MVLLKLKCPPEKRKAVIAVSLSTSSPTCCLNAEEESDSPFQIILALRLEDSTQPGRAITIATRGTVFEPSDPDAGIDTLALNTFSALTSVNDSSRFIRLGNLKPHYARSSKEKTPDLKERYGVHLLTIPADGEVQVKHDMPISRMLKRDGRWTKDDLEPGESYRFHVNPDYLGSAWWCWGDLEGDLKDKKLSAWQEGINSSRAEKPTAEQVESEDWILGGNRAELMFEDKTGDAEFQFSA